MTFKKNKDKFKGKYGIKKQERETDKHILFSLKHAVLNSKKFQLPREKRYLEKFIDRLNFISNNSFVQMTQKHSEAFRMHKITWHKTTEPRGFHFLNQQLIGEKAYQISISQVKYGRVHGFFLGNIFYIVWFDPEHRLS